MGNLHIGTDSKLYKWEDGKLVELELPPTGYIEIEGDETISGINLPSIVEGKNELAD